MTNRVRLQRGKAVVDPGRATTTHLGVAEHAGELSAGYLDADTGEKAGGACVGTGARCRKPRMTDGNLRIGRRFTVTQFDKWFFQMTRCPFK